MKLTPKKRRQLFEAMKNYVATNRCSIISHCITHMLKGRLSYVVACLRNESDKIEQPLRGTLEKIHVLDSWNWFIRYHKYRRRVGLER